MSSLTLEVAMDSYSPEHAPVANEWLEIDEDERLMLVEQYHRDARIRLPKSARRVHATMHTIVENQLALNDEPVVKALDRLMREGLARHDALHAIGYLVSEQIYDILKHNETPDASKARYYAAIERLTAAAWLSGKS
jgi:hypothetical protein